MRTRVGILYELVVVPCHLCLLSAGGKRLSLKEGLNNSWVSGGVAEG